MSEEKTQIIPVADASTQAYAELWDVIAYCCREARLLISDRCFSSALESLSVAYRAAETLVTLSRGGV
jgi:hypothetical protein